MSLTGIEDFNPIIGVQNGKSKTKNRMGYADKSKEAEARSSNAGAGSSAAPFDRTEAEGGMRYLQKDERDNIEVLTVR